MPRKLRYSVAASLDGYIAGPEGQYDWIPVDPEIDFGEMIAEFDTAVMGRNSFEQLVKNGDLNLPGLEIIVFSNTLAPREYPDVTIVNESEYDYVRELKSQEGKDIWLFGGGKLFKSLAENGLVDTVEVAIVPVILGSGISLCAPGDSAVDLKLISHKVYPQSGISMHWYEVV